MPAPRQMSDLTLDAVKGWPSPHAVDFRAKFNAAQLATITGNAANDPPLGVAPAGRCCYLNASGEYLLGCEGAAMPLWTFQNSDDPDVENPGGDPATKAHAWVAIAPVGYIMALPAAGAFQLATTQFDTAQTFAPNELLYAENNVTINDRGKLKNTAVGGAYPATTAVGMVAIGRTPTSANNSHGVAELSFWPLAGVIEHSH